MKLLYLAGLLSEGAWDDYAKSPHAQSHGFHERPDLHTQHQNDFEQEAKAEVLELLKNYSMLMGMVPVRNGIAIKDLIADLKKLLKKLLPQGNNSRYGR